MILMNSFLPSVVTEWKKLDFQNSASLKIFTKLILPLNRGKSNKISQINNPWKIKVHPHLRLCLSHSKMHEMKPSGSI